MHTLSALRRKRDEIAASIAVYEARIEAARMDLAALEQAARLFDFVAEREETAINLECAKPGSLQEVPAARWEVSQSDRPFALGQLEPPVARARGSDTHDSGPFNSLRLWEGQLTREAAAGERIPAEFFYLNWP
jgi:hypothetical protein